MEDLIKKAAEDLKNAKHAIALTGAGISTESGLFVVKQMRATTIIEVNAEPTPLTEEGISDYLIQGKTGAILPEIVQEVKGTAV